MADWNFSGVDQYSQGLTQSPVTVTTTPADLTNDLSTAIMATNPLPDNIGKPPPQDPMFGQAPVDYMSWLTSYMGGMGAPSESYLQAGRDVARTGLPMLGGVAGSMLPYLGGIPGGAAGSALGEAAGQWAAGDTINPSKVGIAGALGAAGGIAGRGVEMGTRMLGHGIKGALGTVTGSLDESPVALTAFQQALNAAQKDFQRVGMYAKGHAATTPANAVLAQLTELQNVMGQVNTGAVPLKTADMLRQIVGGYYDVNKTAALPSKLRDQLYAAIMGDLRTAAGTNPQVGPYLDDLANAYIARGLMPTGAMEKFGGLGAAAMAAPLYASQQNPWAALGPLGLALAALMGRGMARTPVGLAEPLSVGASQSGLNPYK
jgi:hypothetical protein